MNPPVDNLKIGEWYSYFPPKVSEEDNRHFPALIEAIGARRVRVRILMAGAPNGVIKSVSARRLVVQGGVL